MATGLNAKMNAVKAAKGSGKSRVKRVKGSAKVANGMSGGMAPESGTYGMPTPGQDAGVVNMNQSVNAHIKK